VARAVGYIGVHRFDLLEQRLLSAPQACGTYYPTLRPGHARKPLQAMDDISLVAQFSRNGQSLFEEIARSLVVTLGLRHPRQGEERDGRAVFVTCLSAQR
jgi:hypothetical protein